MPPYLGTTVIFTAIDNPIQIKSILGDLHFSKIAGMHFNAWKSIMWHQDGQEGVETNINIVDIDWVLLTDLILTVDR
jgi:hypothetical protein